MTTTNVSKVAHALGMRAELEARQRLQAVVDLLRREGATGDVIARYLEGCLGVGTVLAEDVGRNASTTDVI